MNRDPLPTPSPVPLELLAFGTILVLLMAGGATAALLCVDLLQLVARAALVLPA